MNTDKMNEIKLILELEALEVRKFLLQEESYCNFSLPSYFNFNSLLKKVDTFLKDEKCWRKCDPGKCTKVNHLILNNKDGKYAWTPYQLIHPVLYVQLVNLVTQEKDWEQIRSKFSEFYKSEYIRCFSIPHIRISDDGNGKRKYVHRWKECEQKSIEYALEYQYILKTSITEWHDSLYTHSIPWALHGKKEAKENRGRGHRLLGNCLDSTLQGMSNGQTNGIPRGSVTTDFIAEMVLGYADSELIKMPEVEKIKDYKILRYRKSYRIFVNNPTDGESILKALAEKMIELGMQLNPSRTKVSKKIIIESRKEGHISLSTKQQSYEDFQRHLLMIHSHAVSFPNSGSLAKALILFGKNIENEKLAQEKLLPSISIAVDIAYHNPRVYPQITAILSKLINSLKSDEEKKDVVRKILKRFSNLPNINHMEIWLQRISLEFYRESNYNEPLCKLVNGNEMKIWNNDWICSDRLKELIDPENIIDRNNLKKLGPFNFGEEMDSLRSPD